jgi:hypothetical protein
MPRIGNHKPNPWIVPYFHLPDPEEDLKFRRELGVDNARLHYLNTPRPNQRPESPLHSLNYYRVMTEDAGQDGEAAVATALAQERKNVLGPNLHQNATMAWYENRKDGKGEPRSHTQWNMSLFMIGFNLSEKEFGDIEERISDLLVEDKMFRNPLSHFATVIRFHEIEDILKKEFVEQLGKEGIPKWWFDFAIRGWVRHTALWMKKAGETLADKLQGKKMRVLRGGEKGFMRVKKVQAVTKGKEENKAEEAGKPVKRKNKPRAAAIPKSYVEDGTDSDETEADDPGYVNEQPPTKKSKTAPFKIDMMDELEDEDELPSAPAPGLADIREPSMIVDHPDLPEKQSENVSEAISTPALKDLTPEQNSSVNKSDAELHAATSSPPVRQSNSPPARAAKVARKTSPAKTPAAPKKRMGRPPKLRTTPELPKEKPAPKVKVAKAVKAIKGPKPPKASKPAKQATQTASTIPLLKNSHLLITVRHNPSLRDCISLSSLVTSEIQAKIEGDEDVDVKDLKLELLRAELKDGGLIRGDKDKEKEDLVWLIDDLDMMVRNDKQLVTAVKCLREKDRGGLGGGGMLRLEVVKGVDEVGMGGRSGGTIREKAAGRESQGAELSVEEKTLDKVVSGSHGTNTEEIVDIERRNNDGNEVGKDAAIERSNIGGDDVGKVVAVDEYHACTLPTSSTTSPKPPILKEDLYPPTTSILGSVLIQLVESGGGAADGDGFNTTNQNDDVSYQVLTEVCKADADIGIVGAVEKEGGREKDGGDAAGETGMVIDNMHHGNLDNLEIMNETGGNTNTREIVLEENVGTSGIDTSMSDVDKLGSTEDATEEAKVSSLSAFLENFEANHKYRI